MQSYSINQPIKSLTPQHYKSTYKIPHAPALQNLNDTFFTFIGLSLECQIWIMDLNVMGFDNATLPLTTLLTEEGGLGNHHWCLAENIAMHAFYIANLVTMAFLPHCKTYAFCTRKAKIIKNLTERHIKIQSKFKVATGSKLRARAFASKMIFFNLRAREILNFRSNEF